MRGLYAITPDKSDLATLIAQVRQAIAGGASSVQYRSKQSAGRDTKLQADALRAVTRETGTLFIVNDDIDLALAVCADGVHIGRDDGDMCAISRIRAQYAMCGRAVAASFVIGISCYNEIERAEAAVAAGADYVAFGSFFPSPTKPQANVAAPGLIAIAKARFEVPVVAVGGITINNVHHLIAANVDAVAVITNLFDANDIELRAREFTDLFEPGSHVRQ